MNLILSDLSSTDYESITTVNRSLVIRNFKTDWFSFLIEKLVSKLKVVFQILLELRRLLSYPVCTMNQFGIRFFTWTDFRYDRLIEMTVYTDQLSRVTQELLWLWMFLFIHRHFFTHLNINNYENQKAGALINSPSKPISQTPKTSLNSS